MRFSRIAGALLVVGGIVYGLLGGEYSTLDWLHLRGEIRREHAALNRLYVELDSLGQVADELERDPATQERVARERFGMVREGEILYRVVPQDR